MKVKDSQIELYDVPSPAQEWDKEATRRALDELFQLARLYNSSKAYFELMRFVARFRFYSPFNAMLIHIQMPGARFVATAKRWRRNYRRRIKAGARPIVILQPKGPVIFVFDVIDTEAGENAPPLPSKVENPFEVRKGRINNEYSLTVDNAKRDGVLVTEHDAGSQSAGGMRRAQPGMYLEFLSKLQPEPVYVRVPRKYELVLNMKHSRETKYATLAHELAHLYCGHIGTPNEKWWPDRRGLDIDTCEFEAESVCYLVCTRIGIDNPSDEYLSGYVRKHDKTPPISLDCVMKAAGLIEQMGREKLKPRKEREQ